MPVKGRLEELQKNMILAGVDLVALGPATDMKYILGFAPHADERLCALLVGQEKACMVVPGLNMDEVAAHTDENVSLFPWEDAEGPLKALKQAKEILGVKHTLAVDNTMRADCLLKLQSVIMAMSVKTADIILAPMRVCKSAEEEEALALAAAQADRAMTVAMDACKPGVTEAEVAWVTESTFRKDGAEEVCFTLIAAGPNGAYPHHHSSQKQMQEGDAVIIDIGASLNGYKSDITRMVHLGKPSAEFLNAYENVFQANQAATNAVRPGILAEQIDEKARKSLQEKGLVQYFTHRTGHGIGLDGHEQPWIMAGNNTPLQKGMAFSIEPGVYFPGQFGVRIEDIVIVTDKGVRVLTAYDHKLVIKD